MNIFTPVPLNKRELVSPGDVFSPAFRKKKEQAVWETVSAQLPEMGKSWNIQWMFLAQFL
ncbi:TPA: hypothetical protein ACI3WH_000106 [Streptococcus pneumoniae]|nr:hypothetical protein [Streptococcus pneumoniae]